MNKLLSGKTILITGGSGQLGQAFVRRALAEEARVFFTYFEHRQKADPLVELGAEAFQLNLADMKAIDTFARVLKSRIQRLDVLIHNAALVRDHTIQNLSEEDWDLVLTVDLKAPYYLTKKLLPLLLNGRKTPSPIPLPLKGERIKVRGKPLSKIFMIISRLAFSGGFGISNYASAKAGLAALAKSLAAELAPKNILVNSVNPGFMKSPMTEGLPENTIRKNLEASPLGRFSDPEESADFLIWLCSDQMTQVTGQVFHFESRKI